MMIKQPNQGITPRAAALKELMLSSRPNICTQRAEAYTTVYQTHASEPLIIRRALALSETLKTMTVFINPGELIVGNQASDNRTAPIFPEYAVEWIQKEIDSFADRPGDAFFPDNDTKARLLEICSWWEGKTTLDKGRSFMSEELRSIHSSGIIRAEGNLTSGDAHIAVNNEKLLKIGLDGFYQQAEEALSKLDSVYYTDLKKTQFYRSVLISLKAFRDFILRFASLAESMSETETDPVRKEELESISLNCRHISRKPPESFYQALQLIYFVQLVLQIESNGHSLSLGRVDQYLYPFYRKDISKGLITTESAMELLENTWVKLYSCLKIRSWSHTRFSAGSPLYQNVTIGGQTTDGQDGVNDLSYLILWSVGETRLTQPNLTVRYHKGISEHFLMESIKVIEKGFGMPSFNNDEVVIPALLRLGIKNEDAFNYSAIGCIEIAVPGKWGYRCTGKHFINLMRVFMATMYNGKDTVSGNTFLEGHGEFTDFISFDDLLQEWDRQITFYAHKGVAIDTAIDTVLEQEAPDILCSAFTDDCIERGLTIHEGGTVYDFVSGLQVGIANLGNSLAAVKKLVFEDKRISPENLLHVLEENFSGKEGERIRQLLLNEAPKYGNDDDYVDQLLKRAYMTYVDEVEKYHTIRFGRGPIGCRYYAGTSSISGNVPSGAVVPATPDGRFAGLPLAEGCSPSSGTDLAGPTAVCQSVAKLPTDRILGGVLLNQKLTPAVLADPENKRKLISLIRVFFNSLKGWHIQYNIVDKITLIDAKKFPEKHRDLIVRVAGYSAFFTTLSPDTQDDIINRTEHTFS
ncbi:MAG: glycyl radical protein [Bacteroidetes bacterium]|nr:glycyl radical protein [Bacteroidota bacterium]